MMSNLSLYSDSKLTNRYQTTIPEMVRKALRLEKNDKIRYTINPNGSVVISRAEQEQENDPILAQFLTFLANDIAQNAKNVTSISSDLVDKILPLISDVEIDLNKALSDEDD
ncbi:MAG: type II toxin-antitoxin system PrlF family antitoxin [Desulfobacterales bacterium]|nr:type II toxin-antitoxin system PrlF family antitoxin [Desulfobacterales bacterium]